MKSLLAEINKGRVLVSHGAWSALLQHRGLPSGECPELWNVTHRDEVFAIAQSYVKVGADMIITNSSGGSPFKLEHYGLRDRAAELNEAAATLSREAAGADRLVLGSVGPTGVVLMMGQVSEQMLYDGFCLQIESLQKGGADAICVEAMSAIDEARLAIRAAREHTDLEVICTFSFEKTVTGEYQTLMGVSPVDMVYAVREAGAAIVGAHCTSGYDQLIEVVREIRKVDQLIPILAHFNTGRPVFQNGKTALPITEEMMAAKVQDLVKSGANVIAGCCDATMERIRALANEVSVF